MGKRDKQRGAPLSRGAVRQSGSWLLVLLLLGGGEPGCRKSNRESVATPTINAAVDSSDSDSTGRLLDQLAPTVHLSGGVFSMGSDQAGSPEERPAHEVVLDPFTMDVHEVTNRQFRLFVEATGYVTSAEKRGWSYLFDAKQKGWVKMPGANWRASFPMDPATDNGDSWIHWPVVHVSWDDANAYCDWADKRLPTEAEWEYAARGGLMDCDYPWGNTREPQGRLLANYWQGWFPEENSGADGYHLLAPVESFPKNGYGLYDMAGNAAEWCYDDYDSSFYSNSPRVNPCWIAASNDASLKVVRGGSFLSAENADTGYRVSARLGQLRAMSFVNVGFRTVDKRKDRPGNVTAH